MKRLLEGTKVLVFKEPDDKEYGGYKLGTIIDSTISEDEIQYSVGMEDGGTYSLCIYGDDIMLPEDYKKFLSKTLSLLNDEIARLHEGIAGYIETAINVSSILYKVEEDFPTMKLEKTNLERWKSFIKFYQGYEYLRKKLDLKLVDPMNCSGLHDASHFYTDRKLDEKEKAEAMSEYALNESQKVIWLYEDPSEDYYSSHGSR